MTNNLDEDYQQGLGTAQCRLVTALPAAPSAAPFKAPFPGASAASAHPAAGIGAPGGRTPVVATPVLAASVVTAAASRLLEASVLPFCNRL